MKDLSGNACLLIRREPGGPFLAIRATRGIGFPGGRCEAGETSIECALRETHEEVGVDLRAFSDQARCLGIRVARLGGLTTAAIWLPSFRSLGVETKLGFTTVEGEPLWCEEAALTGEHSAFKLWNRWATTQEMIRRLRSDADSDMMSAWNEENTSHGWAGEAYQESATFTRSVADALERLAEMEYPQ